MKIDGEADAIALECAERIESNLKAEARGGAPQLKARIQCLIRDAIDQATVKQARAAIRGMDAAKAAAYQTEANAVNLFRQCGPEALEAERETNERLTNIIARMEERIEELEDALAKGPRPPGKYAYVADKRRKKVEKQLEQARAAMVAAGICSSCFHVPEMDEDGPFSHCRCGTGEDYAVRPLQRLQVVERLLAKKGEKP